MASKTDIANLALGHFGEYRIVDFLENSPSAEACRDAWDLTRQSVLRSHNWSFAMDDDLLTRLVEAPKARWKYKFALPADYMRLVSCNGVLAGTSDVPFSVRGNTLVSNSVSALIEYIKDVPETEFWDPAFAKAFTFELAEMVAPKLTQSIDIVGKIRQLKVASGMDAMLASAVESRPQIRTAVEGSAYLAARQ